MTLQTLLDNYYKAAVEHHKYNGKYRTEADLEAAENAIRRYYEACLFVQKTLR